MSKANSQKHRRQMKKQRQNRDEKLQRQAVQAVTGPGPAPETPPEATGQSPGPAQPPRPAQLSPPVKSPVCPLCGHVITVEDGLRNVTMVTKNRQDILVHRTCPGEKEK